MNNLLTTPQELAKIKTIPLNDNESSKVKEAIMQAQDFDIQPFLGAKLMLSLYKEPETQDNKFLLDGGEWSEGYFPGLKRAINWFALARYENSKYTNITELGSFMATENNSFNSEARTSLSLSTAYSNGEMYLKYALDYLNANSSLHPDYQAKTLSDNYYSIKRYNY